MSAYRRVVRALHAATDPPNGSPREELPSPVDSSELVWPEEWVDTDETDTLDGIEALDPEQVHLPDDARVATLAKALRADARRLRLVVGG